MATYSKPGDGGGTTNIPLWNTGGTNEVEPLAAAKIAGWAFEDPHSSSTENWLRHRTGDWFQWIDERLADGGTADEFQIIDPAAADTIVEFRTAGVDIQKGGLFVGVGGGSPAANDVIIAGGLAVGHTTDPGDDTITIGDTAFAIGLATDPTVTWDTGDLLTYDRSDNEYDFTFGGSVRYFLDADGWSTQFEDQVFYRQPMGVNATRDGSTDPGADGIRMGHAGVTTQPNISSDLTLGNDVFLIEKTDTDGVNPDGDIVFANTGNDGDIRATLVLRGGDASVQPGFDSAQDLGSAAVAWQNVYSDEITSDSYEWQSTEVSVDIYYGPHNFIWSNPSSAQSTFDVSSDGEVITWDNADRVYIPVVMPLNAELTRFRATADWASGTVTMEGFSRIALKTAGAQVPSSEFSTSDGTPPGVGVLDVLDTTVLGTPVTLSSGHVLWVEIRNSGGAGTNACAGARATLNLTRPDLYGGSQ